MYQNSGIRYGIIAGIAVIAYFLLFYVIDRPLMLHVGVSWSSLLVYGTFMVLACQQLAKRQPAADLKAYLKPAFTVFVIANAAYYLFYYLLFNAIDPSMVEVQRGLLEATLERYDSSLGDAVKKQLSEQIQSDNFGVSFQDAFFGFAWSLIGGFVLALGVAFYFDRRKSVNLPIPNNGEPKL
ncbi:MAG: DUF4199 domain-containing protein [Bacteroidota bacterium]